MIDGLMDKIKNLQKMAGVDQEGMMKQVLDLQNDANLLGDLNNLQMEDMTPKPEKIPVKFIQDTTTYIIIFTRYTFMVS